MSLLSIASSWSETSLLKRIASVRGGDRKTPERLRKGGGDLGSSTRASPASYPPPCCGLLDLIALRRGACKTECQQEHKKEKGHCNSDCGPEEATAHRRSLLVTDFAQS